MKIAPKKPDQGKINLIMLIFSVLDVLAWLILILVAINILSYYIYSWINKGFFDSETLKFALYLAIGAYLICIIDIEIQMSKIIHHHG